MVFSFRLRGGSGHSVRVPRPIDDSDSAKASIHATYPAAMFQRCHMLVFSWQPLDRPGSLNATRSRAELDNIKTTFKISNLVLIIFR
jgi:hypothetical protein